MASVDASISGVAIELQHLTLRRSPVAIPLLSRLLAAAGAGAGRGTARHKQAVAAAAAAADSAGSSSWVEVVALQADEQQPSPATAAHLSKQQQERARLAVSVHYFDQAAAPGASTVGSGKPVAPGQLHCSVAVGRLLLAHAPGFLTSLVLFGRQCTAAASASPFRGGRLPRGRLLGASSTSLWSSRGGNPSKTAAVEHSQPTSPRSPGGSDSEGGSSEGGRVPLLVQALRPQLQLECRVAQLEVAVLSSQAPEAAAAVLLLRQLELHRCAAPRPRLAVVDVAVVGSGAGSVH